MYSLVIMRNVELTLENGAVIPHVVDVAASRASQQDSESPILVKVGTRHRYKSLDIASFQIVGSEKRFS